MTDGESPTTEDRRRTGDDEPTTAADRGPATEETTELGMGRRWAWRTAVFAMALTLLPYLFGRFLQGADDSRGWYSWLGFNLDDSCVYLSWMRQAADGHFFQRNLFTTDPQVGHQFSLLFLLLGNIARFLHLPLLLVYHGSRLLLGVAFLRSAWWLLEMLVASAGARKTAFLVLCFSSGLGWLPGLWRYSGNLSPADVWQTESITYLCLYLSPLFLVSLLLMVGVIGCLIRAERTGEMRFAIYAGLCGLLLGNIHTYDVITLTAIWGGYLVVRGIFERRIDFRVWGQAIVAGLMTAVSSGYMFYLVKTEAVFAKRVDVTTLAPEIRIYLITYGALIVLSLIGLMFAGSGLKAKSHTSLVPNSRALLLLTIWVVLNFAVAYLPVTFNRKLLMGLHIPLSILAGLGLNAVRDKLSTVWPILLASAAILPIVLVSRYIPGVAFAGIIPTIVVTIAGIMAVRQRSADGREQAAIVGVVGLLALTNVLFTARDMNNFLADRGQALVQRPFMYSGEFSALEWLRDHAAPDAAIQPLPWIQRSIDNVGRQKVGPVDTTLAVLAPGITGHPVNAGHWGETPDFGAKMGRWVHFQTTNTPDHERVELLRESGVKYLIFSQKHDDGPAPPADPGLLALFRQSPPEYLHLVAEASNADADIYEVRLP